MRINMPTRLLAYLCTCLFAFGALSGCGDDASPPIDGGAVAGIGGSDGGRPSDAGQEDGAGGSQSGSGGMDEGGGGQAGTPSNRCHEPVIEADDDDCLACALEYCCMASTAGACLSPPIERRENDASPCYQNRFRGCIVDCYSMQSPRQPDVGSWDIVAGCVDRCEGDIDDAGTDARVFPLNHSSANDLVECIVGSTADDPGVSEDTPGPLNHLCDLKTTCYHRSPCAERCFPNWR
jgi:hypothetical protein